ncbi:MAG: hypothetical protein ACOZJX_13145 [Pseudomonadota bacterium]
MTTSAFAAPLQTLWRVLSALIGLALLAGMLLLGLAIATGLVLWALVRGRKPRMVHAAWPRGMRTAASGWHRGTRPAPTRPGMDDVAEAQVVREIAAPGHQGR